MPDIHNRKNLKPFRKSLRNNATSAEASLWKILKKRQIGNLKFRRQHSIEKYIVDFYCPELKLAIELDGEYHSEPEILSDDYEKDECLEKDGVRTLRYENRWVFECPEDIIDDILNFQAKGRNYVIIQSTTPLKSMANKSHDENS